MTALSARLNVARQVLKIFFLPEDTQLGFDKKKKKVKSVCSIQFV